MESVSAQEKAGGDSLWGKTDVRQFWVVFLA